VEAGWSTSTVALRVVGGDRKGTQSQKRQIWSQELRDLDPRVTALEVPSSNCTSKLQTRPLVREDASQYENCKCLKIISKEVKEGRGSQMVA
jgi:hypothetical protein